MENRKPYCKPILSVVSLRANRSVADRCWSPESQQHTAGGWYNAPGYGGLNFKMEGGGSGNCAASSTTFIINYYIGNYGETITEEAFYAQHPELNPSMIEGECRTYVQGNWPAFNTKDPEHLDPNPPHWPWSV